MGERVVFTKLPHDELPKAYAAANVFTLGSVFETFGIVYVEAMAMGLPVICTNHVNQRDIVKDGVFIDVKKPGALTAALQPGERAALQAMGHRAHKIAANHYDLEALKRKYVEQYQAIAAAKTTLPTYSLVDKLIFNARSSVRKAATLVYGRAE